MTKYPFKVYQNMINGKNIWIAQSSVIKDCKGQGENQMDAISNLEKEETKWLEHASKSDVPIPDIHIEHPEDYSGKMTLRLAPYVHMQAAMIAQREGISLNQYISNAVISQNATLSAIDKQ